MRSLFLVLLGFSIGANSLNVTIDFRDGQVSPDGGPSRTGILINGAYGGPLIKVAQGEPLNVTLLNNLGGDQYTGYFGATSVHWHGFGMKGIPYLDGTSYVSQCPLQRNGDATEDAGARNRQEIIFVVNEAPGTYLYHEHKSMLAADGLFGAIIVTGPEDELYKTEYNLTDDRLLLVSEFYEADSPNQAKGLNQPFPLNDSQTGPEYFTWIGAPRSLLLNLQGCVNDCTPPGANETDARCDPDPSCDTRFVMDVEPDAAYRVRMVGAGSLLFQVICFEGHELTLIQVDARPIQPVVLKDGCVDINLGQRMDVVLKSKSVDEIRQANSTSFWITGRATGRSGNPASYGVLSYAHGRTTGATGKGLTTLPTSAPLQPSAVPNWSEDGFDMKIKSPVNRVPEWVKNKQPADRTIFLAISQPILQQTAQIRWAMSNAVYLKSPACTNALELSRNSSWLSASNPYVIDTQSEYSNVNILEMPGLGGNGEGNTNPYIFLNLESDNSVENSSIPQQPLAGTPLVETTEGQIIDIVMQNLPAGSLGGIDLNRTNEEQHPMHIHGHHVYVVGSGPGLFSDLVGSEAIEPYLNYNSPSLRDTVTLPKGGWVLMRFKSSNPGIWPLHCHIQAHEFMGMVLLIGENIDAIPVIPDDVELPQCTEECVYSAKIYNQTTTNTEDTTSDTSLTLNQTMSSAAHYSSALTLAPLISLLALYL